jgi:hypothetical protein
MTNDQIHVAEDVCAPVAHRQVVLTIPKRLRLHTLKTFIAQQTAAKPGRSK